MRLLFCCEFYFPSVGGVQEVMRQLAERMVKNGHEVTVATTRLGDRDFSEYNGVRIVEFGVTGNSVRGMRGEMQRYREFVTTFPCDALLIKAAQQWTFDALWPVIDQISVRKVFIPCGFSGLYEPTYEQYFQDLPEILRKFDHLIFYAERYRDTDFARHHGLTNFSILPNGASETEFSVAPDPDFRTRHGIPESSFVLLTVGSLTGVKGHREIAEAVAKMKTHGRHVTLILNGNLPPRPMVTEGGAEQLAADSQQQVRRFVVLRRLTRYATARAVRLGGLAYRSFGVLRREGMRGVRQRVSSIIIRKLPLARFRLIPRGMQKVVEPLSYWIGKINHQAKYKKVLEVDLPRAELVQAFMAADLFVFASNIEYSPLVLFETAAAGTPFLSVPVGNAEEIAKWTNGGVICPAPKDERGYTRVEPKVLAKAIEVQMRQPKQLEEMGKAAKASWEESYTWAAITARYEKILAGGERV